jgi:Bacterial membrane protein YfhO
MNREWGVRIAVLAAAVVVTFGGAVFTDQVLYERDILNYWCPHIEVFVRAVAEHALPLWNPYTGFGAPLLADPSLALAYPPTWLNLVMGPAIYYKWLVVSHCAWGGLGVLLLARQLRLPADASLVAALAFCLSGPFLSAASLFHHYTGAAWMPWVLLGLERLLRAPSAGSALRLGVAAALQILAGSGDLCLMTLLAGVFLVPGIEGPSGKPRFATSTVKWGILAVGLAVGLAAVQWAPTGELLAGGVRSQQGNQSLYWSLHPASLPDLAALDTVRALPLSAAARGDLYEGRDPLLSSIYWGPFTLVLALMGVVLPGPGRAGLATGLATGLAFFLGAALGRHTPFYPLLLHLPLLPLLRYPTKYLWAATLFAALLAGLGVSSWARPWSLVERRRAALVAAFVGLAALAALSYAAALHLRADGVARWLEPGASTAALDSPVAQAVVAALLLGAAGFAIVLRLTERAVPWSALAVVLVAGDLARAGRGVNPLGPRSLFETRPALLDTLKASGAPRVYSAGSRPQLPVEMPVRGPMNWRPEWTRSLGVLDRLIPPTPSRWGLFGSFDGDFTGLAGRSYSELTTLTNAVRDREEGTVLLRLGGVDYVVTLDPGVFGGSLPEAARVDSVYASPVFLLSVPNTLPRVFVVDGVRPVAEADAEKVLVASDFDASREVLASGYWEASPSHAGFRGSARVFSRRVDSLSLEADLDGPGVLVVLEAYHPGWQATVDGRPAPIFRANALFRGVPLAAGHHRVEMAFRPRSATWGALLSLCTLLGVLALGLREARESSGRLSTPKPSL